MDKSDADAFGASTNGNGNGNGNGHSTIPKEVLKKHLNKNGSERKIIVPEIIVNPAGTGKLTAMTNGTSSVGIINDDSLEGLKTLESGTFNVAVTSPPYYWARDYGVDGQIGHEETVEEFVSSLMKVFDEVHRLLHSEGVFYLNIGDTYYSGNGQPHGSDPRSPSRNFMRRKMRAVDRSGWSIPKKSLIGVPWKVAFAMQERGWTLRSDIIWNRCNAFTEPTALDRPYRQYEHVFLFSKSRFYSFDRSELPEEDVWNIPIQRAKRIDHSAPFPAELVRRCILTGSPEGGKVLDPFLGSGTTLDVALELKRHGVGVELSSKYAEDFIDHLKKKKCTPIEWKTLAGDLNQDSEKWDTWSGNRKNYRKPGSGKIIENGDLELVPTLNNEILHNRTYSTSD